MKVLITGAHGQLGRELLHTRPAEVEPVAEDADRLDITDREAVRAFVEGERPELIVNAAAWTAVDRAEEEAEAARAVNEAGAAHLAEAAEGIGARLIQISTDFVFDGVQGTPYRPEDPCRPLGVYGATKRAGEERVLEISGGRALVVRTAWVYAAGGANFVATMLRLMAERDSIRVVDDQLGTPTWARTLAEAIWKWSERPEVAGIRHWTDAGVASWYDFACAIQEEGLAAGLLERPVRIDPIPGSAWPTPAKRPACGVLDKHRSWEELGVSPLHWREALRRALAGWYGGEVPERGEV